MQVGGGQGTERRFRARRAAGIVAVNVAASKPARPLPRPARWARALDELRQLQGEYEAWRHQLPESLGDTRTAALLEEVCELDLGVLDVELPRGGA